MTKKDIRLQYSGVLLFIAKMLTVVTGLYFQRMIASVTLPEHRGEYDMWFNVNDLLAYFTLMAGVLPFWTMRFAARGKEGVIKTGVIANLAISIIATLIYLPLVPIITSLLGIEANYFSIYFVVSIQIVELYLMSMLEACLQARVPHTVGYGLIVQQVSRVILGYVFIIQLQQRVLGAVIATIIAFLIQAVFYFKLIAEELKGKVKWEYAKEWLKGSVANIYNVAGNQIAAYIFIMLFTYAEGARGRYGTAWQIANVITFASFLAFALYPKLIAEKKSEDITTSLKLVLMFAIPMTVGAIALSDSFMILITEDIAFKDSAPVLAVLAVDAFVIIVSGFYSSVLFGLEKVDETSKISFKKLAQSRLFIAFSLPYLHSAITIPTTFYVLANYGQNIPSQAAFYVSIINLSAHIAMFLILYFIVRKMTEIEIPWSNIAKYALASAVMATFLSVIPHPSRASLILGVTAVASLIYLALLLGIDKEARMLSLDILKEAKGRIKRKT